MARIALLGATGRMGRALARLISEDPGLDIVGAATEPGDALVGRDIGALTGGDSIGAQIIDTPADAVRGADVAIDFSLPAAFDAHLAATRAEGCAMVVGTTGLSGEQQAALAAAAADSAIVYGRNMSVGINVLTALAARAGAALDADYDVEITDRHHRLKVDAPSGTALQLCEAVAAAREASPADVVHGRDGAVGERPRGQIGIHAIRAGSIVGDHDVIFAADEEIVTLSHRALDRAVFARGALRAARWVVAQPPGLYGMPDVLGLR